MSYKPYALQRGDMELDLPLDCYITWTATPYVPPSGFTGPPERYDPGSEPELEFAVSHNGRDITDLLDEATAEWIRDKIEKELER